MQRKYLRQDRLKELFDYDRNSGVFTRNKLSNGAKRISGSKRSDGYLTIYIDGKHFLCHRLAWLFCYGNMPDYIDHKNGDRTDNRIENLREATKAENAQNLRAAYKNNKSTGILGVYKHSSGKYQARIQLSGKAKSLGLYADIKDAKNAYISAKRKSHDFCMI